MNGCVLFASTACRRLGIRAEREASPASVSDLLLVQRQWPTEALAIAA